MRVCGHLRWYPADFFSILNPLATYNRFKFEISNPLATHKITRSGRVFMGEFERVYWLAGNFAISIVYGMKYTP